MATSNERVQDFESIRRLLWDMYVDGSKLVKYEDLRSKEKLRQLIKEWLEGAMESTEMDQGKAWHIPIDSRVVSHNPFYILWKIKSFHDMDVAKFFLILDVLHPSESEYPKYSVSDIMTKISSTGNNWDIKTVSDTLQVYCDSGLVVCEKEGKKNLYSFVSGIESHAIEDLLDLFSEVAPCGVLGSFLMDKNPKQDSVFRFKHHYLASALDSDVLVRVLDAMHRHRRIRIRIPNGDLQTVIPLQIRQSVQTGRQYLLAYNEARKKIRVFPINKISTVAMKEDPSVSEEYWQEIRQNLQLDEIQTHMWGVTLDDETTEKLSIKHVEFLVHADSADHHVVERLKREKRCGTVEKIDDLTYKFSADVWSTKEMKPWIRSFFGYISDLQMDGAKEFVKELEKMYQMYDIGEESQE